jgi:dGTPase
MQWAKLLSAGRLGRKGPGKYDEGRSPFQKDFDRIVFSSAFRRLQDKTQVFPLAESDYVRTRLTHSLEVSCVGRTLGTIVGATIRRSSNLAEEITAADFGAIVATACLAHDLGNPPFGHSGERAIQHWFAHSETGKSIRRKLNKVQRNNIDRYEGNAEGFRLVTWLLTPDNPGLQLTYATLGTMMKYPVEASVPAGTRGNGASTKKFGFFEAERKSALQVAASLGLLSRSKRYVWFCRHPLAFLMEAADDICYRISDFEDGCRLNLIDESLVQNLLLEIIDDLEAKAKVAGLKQRTARVQYLRALAIAKLVNETAQEFLARESELLAGRFDQPLIDVISSAAVLKEIYRVTKESVYPHRPVIEIEAAGFEVIGGLLDAFASAVEQHAGKGKTSHKAKKLIELMPPEFCAAGISSFDRLLSVIDFVCGMTDTYAVALYRKLKGISLATAR